jgi:hypothetical protein
MMITLKDNKEIKTGDELGNALIELINENLKLQQWNFQKSFANFNDRSSLVIIYDSSYCRLSFRFSRQRSPEWDELTIQYGRLHAPDQEPFMIWEGQKCRCWHNVIDPLRFLDGLSPSESVEQAKTRKQLPDAIRAFRDSEQGKKLLAEYPPKSAIVMHSKLWERYGHRLFELFDLRKPQLWMQYQQFIKEYHRLIGTKVSYGPPPENIC